ncbi:3-deoxy-7-phosphoheptulonate synthase [bacterium]|nr:3-deoxy-7-phosphoheptulonate synthase [bacterium]MBU4361414.1 3-deoxy-7-phosphoheptulonate synthase [bacterium]MBU4602779.1 3-deoxy-7-phosphoheptulonate synthase [bacterium]MCG2762115.1 3-deoxy-7-phosphoheptulonate synthase [Candidatus Atribacteria bacterium]
MIIVMNGKTDDADVEKVIQKLHEMGHKVHISRGEKRIILGVIGDVENLTSVPFYAFNGVEEIIRIVKPYKLASREFKSFDTTVKVKDVVIGGKEVVVMAGPCVVENEKQIFETAQQVKAAGAKILRGGAFKPRTSPYSFQGLGEEGLKLLAQAGEETGLAVVTEVMSVNQIELVGKYTDIFQVGARNMQNFVLLQELGKAKKPILLKRGMSATIEELLLSAEYILSQGNYEVILCERGIRTFENYTRNTLDLSAVPALKRLSHLPVIVDPSHATGRWRLVSPMAKAAIAVGADGLLIEVHPDPKSSLSDGAQTLRLDTFTQLMKELSPIVQAVGRELGTSAEDDLERMKN